MYVHDMKVEEKLHRRRGNYRGVGGGRRDKDGEIYSIYNIYLHECL